MGRGIVEQRRRNRISRSAEYGAGRRRGRGGHRERRCAGWKLRIRLRITDHISGPGDWPDWRPWPGHGSLNGEPGNGMHDKNASEAQRLGRRLVSGRLLWPRSGLISARQGESICAMRQPHLIECAHTIPFIPGPIAATPLLPERESGILPGRRQPRRQIDHNRPRYGSASAIAISRRGCDLWGIYLGELSCVHGSCSMTAVRNSSHVRLARKRAADRRSHVSRRTARLL